MPRIRPARHRPPRHDCHTSRRSTTSRTPASKGSIERWAWFHIKVGGGTLINRIDGVRPDDPDSSMKLWCIDYGDFGVALIEGIDRAGQSQVTKFVERHGDHACQHV